MSDIDVQEQQHMNVAEQGETKPTEATGNDQRTDQEKEADRKLAERLSHIIEEANSKCLPLCNMIRKHIEQMDAKKEEDRDENELVKSVKPLLQQAEQILNETNGAIRGADPDNRLSNKAKRNMQDHTATPDEQRLAEALKVMVQEVGGTIEWAKDKLDAFPKAKRDLGPLLDAMGQPLTQIIGGVGLLLAGVLNLVNKLLSALGLDCLLKGIVAATGLDKIYKGLGLGNLLKM
jgi:chromosome segregation ATPase